MAKKITIKKWDADGTILTVQNNEKGVFGPAQDIELSREETSGLTFDEIMEQILGETEPKKSTMFLPISTYIMTNKKTLIYVLTALIIIGAFSILFMLPKSATGTITVQGLESEIKTIRTNRETKYDACVAVCDAERGVFDAQVIHKQKMIEKIK